MNTKTFLINLCIVCTTLLLTACDKADLKSTGPSEIGLGGKLQNRTLHSCDDCPVNSCCCEALLISGSSIALELCGTNSPDNTSTTCSGSSGNCNVSGRILNLSLSSFGPTGALFCMAPGNPFRITSTSGSGTVRLSCQWGQLSPQSVDIAFPTTRFLDVNSSCEIAGCE